MRHTYDLHQLLHQEEFSDFFNSPAFTDMLLKVAEDDIVSYKNNNLWLKNHPNEALFFKEIERVWEEIKPVYITDFKNLVYGRLPSAESILATMLQVKERLGKIDWQIKLPEIED